MYIKMVKRSESDNHVWYEFECDVDAAFVHDSGDDEIDFEVKALKGVFCFNRKTEELDFDEDLTDPYFFEEQGTREACLEKMRECQEEGVFPEVIEHTLA